MKLTIDIDEDDIKLFDSMSLERVCNNLDDLVESFAENSLIGFLDRLVDIKLNLEELAVPLGRLNSVIASAYFEAKQTFTNGSFDQAVGRTKRKRDWKLGDELMVQSITKRIVGNLTSQWDKLNTLVAVPEFRNYGVSCGERTMLNSMIQLLVLFNG